MPCSVPRQGVRPPYAETPREVRRKEEAGLGQHRSILLGFVHIEANEPVRPGSFYREVKSDRVQI